jgi:uncharacterized membrane protein YfcA
VLVLGVALSVLVGVAIGLLGGGGSILTVTLLVYVLALPPHEAIATSLLVVGATSVAAVVAHARAGRVAWRTGLLFGLAGMVGSFGGARVARHIPAGLLLVLFGAVMLATAIAMLRGGAEPAHGELPDAARTRPGRHAGLIGQGLLVGAVTGLVGAGGGFLVVPALTLLGGLPMNVAVGTSLVVVALNALAGFVGHLGASAIDVELTALVTGAALVGSLVGSRLAGRIPPDALRRGFGVFVVAMAIFILGQQIPESFGVAPGIMLPWAALAALLTLVVGFVLRAVRRTRLPTPRTAP